MSKALKGKATLLYGFHAVMGWALHRVLCIGFCVEPTPSLRESLRKDISNLKHMHTHHQPTSHRPGITLMISENPSLLLTSCTLRRHDLKKKRKVMPRSFLPTRASPGMSLFVKGTSSHTCSSSSSSPLLPHVRSTPNIANSLEVKLV